MITVRVVNDFSFLGGIESFFKNRNPIINGVHFTDQDVPTDYILVWEHNMYKSDFVLHHDPSRVWAVDGEPDSGVFHTIKDKWANAERVYSSADVKYNDNNMNAPEMINWFVGKSYDEIIKYKGENKTHGVGFITSNKSILPGHKKRMAFIKTIKGALGNDLYLAGKGFQHIKTKWDGLVPYKYNLSIENHISDFTMTEKLFDSWAVVSLPLYYGSPCVDKYFPEKSLIRIDIEDKFVGEKIKEIINSDLFEERLPYILEAREILLNKHNMFNRLANDIITHNQLTPKQPPQQVILEHAPIRYPLTARIKSKFNDWIKI